GIAVWGGFALAALAAWFATRGVRALVPAPAPRAGGEAERGAGRQPSTWLLALAFAGQSFAFYATAAWLPSLLLDQGLDEAGAGAVASVFHIAGIAGALLLPVLSNRTSLALGGTVTGLAWLAIPLGFLLA